MNEIHVCNRITMSKRSPLDDFLSSFESAPNVVTSFSKLYKICDYSPIECCWESVDVMESYGWEAISEQDFLQAEKLNTMYCELSEEDKYKSRVNQYQCWMCDSKIFPAMFAHGVNVSFRNMNGNEIKNIEGIQCQDCYLVHQLDEYCFVLQTET